MYSLISLYDPESNDDIVAKDVVLNLVSDVLDDLPYFVDRLAYSIKEHEDHHLLKELVTKHIIEIDNELMDIILL